MSRGDDQLIGVGMGGSCPSCRALATIVPSANAQLDDSGQYRIFGRAITADGSRPDVAAAFPGYGLLHGFRMHSVPPTTGYALVAVRRNHDLVALRPTGEQQVIGRVPGVALFATYAV